MLVNSSQTSTDANAGGFALYSQKPKNNSHKKTSKMAQKRTINSSYNSTTTPSLINRKIPFNPINKGHQLVLIKQQTSVSNLWQAWTSSLRFLPRNELLLSRPSPINLVSKNGCKESCIW